MEKYLVCICTNIHFGEWDIYNSDSKTVANEVWKDFNSNKTPMITFHDNKFKTWNMKFERQPEKLQYNEWPKFAKRAYESHKNDVDYLGAVVFNYDDNGILEFSETRFDKNTGLKKTSRTFCTYETRNKPSKELFTVVELR